MRVHKYIARCIHAQPHARGNKAEGILVDSGALNLTHTRAHRDGPG